MKFKLFISGKVQGLVVAQVQRQYFYSAVLDYYIMRSGIW